MKKPVKSYLAYGSLEYMHLSENIRTFTEKYPLLGPTVWLLCIHYFFIQYLVAQYWDPPFNIKVNPISDLGNTECGMYAMRYVCSPKHFFMNASFILLGAFMILGAALIYQGFKKTALSFIGFGLMGIAGFGAVIVGLFPENTIHFMHGLGAFLAFLLGNLGIVLLGFALDLPKSFKFFTIFVGVFSLTALALYGTQNYLIFGEGGMERLAAYPQTFWLIIFGVYISAHRYRILHSPHTGS